MNEWVDRFLDGTLSSEERAQFTARLSEDSDLRKLVEIERKLRAMEQAQRFSLENRKPVLTPVLEQLLEETPTKGAFTSFRKSLLLLLGLLLFVAVYAVINTPTESGDQQVQQAIPERQISNTKSQSVKDTLTSITSLAHKDSDSIVYRGSRIITLQSKPVGNTDSLNHRSTFLRSFGGSKKDSIPTIGDPTVRGNVNLQNH